MNETLKDISINARFSLCLEKTPVLQWHACTRLKPPCSRTCALGYLQVRALVSGMPIVMNVLVVKLRSGCMTKGGGIL